MAWEKTASSDPSEPRSEGELKRLQAYEGLVVVVIVTAALLVFGGAIAIALSSSLGDVAHALAGP